jgi:hypothetical protein
MEFVSAALEDFRRAEEMLAKDPGIQSAGLYAALVLGDILRVERELDAHPEMAHTKGRCTPLGAAAVRVLLALRGRPVEPRRPPHRDCAVAFGSRRESECLVRGRTMAG